MPHVYYGGRRQFLRPVASGQMIGFDRVQGGVLGSAAVDDEGAAGMEAAAGGRVRDTTSRGGPSCGRATVSGGLLQSTWKRESGSS